MPAGSGPGSQEPRLSRAGGLTFKAVWDQRELWEPCCWAELRRDTWLCAADGSPPGTHPPQPRD